MITILIVDDDPHIRELLRFYLQKGGYKTIEAADGQDALQQLEENSIHLAVVDIMMPNVDGYQLCEEIRNNYDIPVLMLTAKDGILDKEKAYAAYNNIREDVSMTFRKPYPQEHEIGLPRMKMK